MNRKTSASQNFTNNTKQESDEKKEKIFHLISHTRRKNPFLHAYIFIFICKVIFTYMYVKPYGLCIYNICFSFLIVGDN